MMRRRRRVFGRSRLLRAADGAVVVLALAVAAAVAARTTSVQPGHWPNDSVMHNVSGMIERLLDNYDIRLRPQFGGRH